MSHHIETVPMSLITQMVTVTIVGRISPNQQERAIERWSGMSRSGWAKLHMLQRRQRFASSFKAIRPQPILNLWSIYLRAADAGLHDHLPRARRASLQDPDEAPAVSADALREAFSGCLAARGTGDADSARTLPTRDVRGNYAAGASLPSIMKCLSAVVVVLEQEPVTGVKT